MNHTFSTLGALAGLLVALALLLLVVVGRDTRQVPRNAWVTVGLLSGLAVLLRVIQLFITL